MGDYLDSVEAEDTYHLLVKCHTKVDDLTEADFTLTNTSTKEVISLKSLTKVDDYTLRLELDNNMEQSEYELSLKNISKLIFEGSTVGLEVSPSPEPTATPTVEPTETPTATPRVAPTVTPTVALTVEPTSEPTVTGTSSTVEVNSLGVASNNSVNWYAYLRKVINVMKAFW